MSGLTVVAGTPSPEELAALVAVLGAVRDRPAPPPETRVVRRTLRGPLLRGPRGWRESSWNLGGVR
ncbi:acyl-CoA carboxylase subunit epsilon [Thermopolyspora sp. NPDC052614]|uniref:acyl-CoA carboxylase subunit epsilon n=1 Tax=Thermopolyspora sp. NPDC052614 TaxID=3155682 RepID=UPI0034495EE6